MLPLFSSRFREKYFKAFLNRNMRVAAGAAIIVVCGVKGRAEADAAAQMLQTFKVTESRLHTADLDKGERVDRYDEGRISDSGAFSVDEFLDTLPPGEKGEQLVLIDGQPTYLDLSTLPLEMIAGIDVSRDGSIPSLGAYSSGRVLNVRLKKNYTGSTAGLRLSGPFSGGGGDQQSFTLSGGATRGKLRAIVSLKYENSERMAATERAFSRDQDHTARGGRDLRLALGSPATVEAVSGFLSGVTDAAGNPVRTALVPEAASNATASAADFIGGGVRRFNTASYLSLVSPSQRLGANLSLNYALTKRIGVSLTGSYTERRSDRIGAPPVSEPSVKTRVPAQFNPFGQDVEIGLVHEAFGPTRQETRARMAQIGLRLDGSFAEAWHWTTGVGLRRNENRQRATDLDQDKFSAALVAIDPALRFDPFGGINAAATDARLYPSLVTERTREDTSTAETIDIGISGPLLTLPGGPLSLSFRSDYHNQQRDRVSTHALGAEAPETRQQSASESGSTALTMPFIGRANSLRGVRRLELQLSARYAKQSEDGITSEQGLGLVWAVSSELSFHSRYVMRSEAPPRSEVIATDSLVTETLVDPSRPDSPVSNVSIATRDLISAEAEKRERLSLGLGFEPTWFSGFRVSADYSARHRRHLLQSEFDAQDLINNELAFPGRVVRAPRTAEDIASGRPGEIVSIDTTPGNAGEQTQRELDFSAEYLVPGARYGRFRVTASAERILESRYDVQPGVAFIHENDQTSNPPDWTMRCLIAWARGSWIASGNIRYTGSTAATAGKNDGIPPSATLDLNAGYTLKRALYKKFGRGMRVALGVVNVTNTQPTWVDTLAGYRGASPIGRIYTVTMTVPL